MGIPNIQRHNRYRDILQNPGTLLDYGCGTGDDIRALVKDGFPTRNIVGYDVNWNSIELGFDLYLDRDTLNNRFVVKKNFPFRPYSFNTIYSGSVLHVFETNYAMIRYVSNAYRTLCSKGIFFGSMVWFPKGRPDEMWKGRRRWYWKWRSCNRISPEELVILFYQTGFLNVEVSQEKENDIIRVWFYAEKAT